MLLDLSEFYEHIDHVALVESACEHKFPPMLLLGALHVNRGQKYISRENRISPAMEAGTSIIARCPYAPGPSILAMHQ